VLDLRIETKVTLSLEPVSLSDVSSDALDLIHPMVLSRVSPLGSLPTFAGAVYVHADRPVPFVSAAQCAVRTPSSTTAQVAMSRIECEALTPRHGSDSSHGYRHRHRRA